MKQVKLEKSNKKSCIVSLGTRITLNGRNVRTVDIIYLRDYMINVLNRQCCDLISYRTKYEDDMPEYFKDVREIDVNDYDELIIYNATPNAFGGIFKGEAIEIYKKMIDFNGEIWYFFCEQKAPPIDFSRVIKYKHEKYGEVKNTWNIPVDMDFHDQWRDKIYKNMKVMFVGDDYEKYVDLYFKLRTKSKGKINDYGVWDLNRDVDWAIYVDGDTLWLGDISDLWKLRNDSKLIMASIDPPTPMGTPSPEFKWYAERGLDIDPKGYLCMGLMLANLNRMRGEKIADKCRSFMTEYPCPRVVDQTVLNYVCKGLTAALPLQWGVFSVWHGNADISGSACVHYVNDVPWRRDKMNRLISDVVLLWYEFAKRVIGCDLRKKYISSFSWFWRRCAFWVLKHNQWILRLHPYLKSRLRNTHGIDKRSMEMLLSRYCR